MKFNFLVILISAFIPLIIGSIWYNPRLFGKFLDNEGQNGNSKHKTIVYFFTFILSLAYSSAMAYQVIHQMHFSSLMMNEVGFANGEGKAFSDFNFIMDIYGNNFRTFKHGMFHGLLNSLFIVLPILAINGMFENKTWRYIFIHWGYWAVNGVIMGGIICQFF